MPKFRCTCGDVINLSSIPNDAEGQLISDQDLERLEGELELVTSRYLSALAKASAGDFLAAEFGPDYPKDSDPTSVLTDLRTRAENKYVRAVIECSSCNRLHVQVRPSVNEYVSLKPEDGARVGLASA